MSDTTSLGDLVIARMIAMEERLLWYKAVLRANCFSETDWLPPFVGVVDDSVRGKVKRWGAVHRKTLYRPAGLFWPDELSDFRPPDPVASSVHLKFSEKILFGYLYYLNSDCVIISDRELSERLPFNGALFLKWMGSLARLELIEVIAFKSQKLKEITFAITLTGSLDVDGVAARLERERQEENAKWHEEYSRRNASIRAYIPPPRRSFSSYEEYLESDEWADLRLRRLKLDRFRCQMPGCGAAKNLHVHHIHYPPWGEWGAESLDDLITLCRKCHEEVHGLSGTA